ncbi:hypothetical protein JCM5353_008275 [Sporobolomyces roseus]
MNTRPPFPRRRALFPFISLTCLGFVSFFKGFFPVKPLLPGYNNPTSYSHATSNILTSHEGLQDSNEKPFSRLVFMLVDALRSDFVFGPDSNMHFARSLVASGRAIPYTAIAQPPTVTLPRLKGLTTGSNPTFLDAILNIADEGSNSAALENTDSWIRQFAKREKETKIVFAGDDTWLRLFPEEWFEWSEGVSSFFVSDTQTVDSNVTRHLDSLLSQSSLQSLPPSDWDVLILHYLGLDHVGHLEGPKSAMMRPKQEEMDGVFERLYRAMEERDREDGEKSLLVMIGDHGMTEGGNHGGSTESETSSALLIASPSLNASISIAEVVHASPYRFHEVVQQVDLATTLSVLFDFGIPKNSMGRLITSAVAKLRPSAVDRGMSANVAQMRGVLLAAGIDVEQVFCEAKTRRGQTCEESNLPIDSKTASLFLQLAQEELLVSFGDYKLPYLFASIVVFLVSAIGLVCLSISTARSENPRSKKLVGAAILLHLVSFFATSFIEEEHEFWFFAAATAFLLLAISSKRRPSDRVWLLFASATIRIMRGWSHNGQKDYPNTSISAYLARHSTTTFLFASITYIIVTIIPFISLGRAARGLAGKGSTPAQLLRKSLGFAILATTISLQAVVGVALKSAVDQVGNPGLVLQSLNKVGLDEPLTLARLSYCLGGIGWLFATILSKSLPRASRFEFDNIRLSILSLILMSLTRATNQPLFTLFWVQHFTMNSLSETTSPLVFAFLSIALQSSSFFALGGSNSLATADLSQAYNGLSSYSFPLVTLFTYLSNFSIPILISLSSQILRPSHRAHTIYTTTFFSLSLSTLAISAIHFRYHLFAFTVFSPAVLYKGAWWFVVHLGTNEGLSRLLLL